MPLERPNVAVRIIPLPRPIKFSLILATKLAMHKYDFEGGYGYECTCQRLVDPKIASTKRACVGSDDLNMLSSSTASVLGYGNRL